jgi:hypothetical protein
MEYKRIDPLKIPESDLPLIVCEEDRRSFLGWAIKSHSKGQYNHIMELFKPCTVASQDPGGFKEKPIDLYLKPQVFLKFWRYKGLTEDIKKDWLSNINNDLKQPWWRKRYDFLGILGQALNIKWIQSPWANYCSERVDKHIAKPLKICLSKGSTPSDINMAFNTNPKFEVYGYWFMD